MDFPGCWQVAIHKLLVTAVCLSTQAAMAQPPQKDVIASLPNIKSPTLGGKQFWTDHAWRQGWRLQRNAITGHWRLLDVRNVRHAWGSRLACETALESEGLENTLPTTHAVVLLHGLMRSAESMRSLGEHLANAGEGHQFSIVYFEYASSRGSISDHAQALGEFVASLPPEATLSLVGHSMGNIVARHWIGDLQQRGR